VGEGSDVTTLTLLNVQTVRPVSSGTDYIEVEAATHAMKSLGCVCPKDSQREVVIFFLLEMMLVLPTGFGKSLHYPVLLSIKSSIAFEVISTAQIKHLPRTFTADECVLTYYRIARNFRGPIFSRNSPLKSNS